MWVLNPLQDLAFEIKSTTEEGSRTEAARGWSDDSSGAVTGSGMESCEGCTTLNPLRTSLLSISMKWKHSGYMSNVHWIL